MNISAQQRSLNKGLKTASLTSLLLLAACSGGGGGEQAPVAGSDQANTGVTPTTVSPTPEAPLTPVTPATPEPAPEPEPLPPIDIESTAELEVSEDFVFGTSFELPLDVDLSSRITEDALLVVCRQFEEVGGRYEVDYSDCILRAPLQAGLYQGSLKLTNDTRALVAAVWYYDEGVEPEHHAWSQADSPEGFVVR